MDLSSSRAVFKESILLQISLTFRKSEKSSLANLSQLNSLQAIEDNKGRVDIVIENLLKREKLQKGPDLGDDAFGNLGEKDNTLKSNMKLFHLQKTKENHNMAFYYTLWKSIRF